MAKIAALGAYLYQSVLAFGLLIAVSNLLPAADFAAYSLIASILQFGDIVFFQWIRAACTRFYPGQTDHDERTQRGVVTIEALLSSLVCLLLAVLAPLFGGSLWLGLIVAVLTVMQGAGELHLTMLRFRQQFRLFSWLQGARATILAAATLIGAAIRPDLLHVLAGLLAGNLVYSAIAWAASRHVLAVEMRWRRDVAGEHLVYGGVAAGAGVATLLTPLGLKAILVASLGPAAAGPMLALDLLQRPFVMIVSSLQAIRYPELVNLFDRIGESRAFRDELARYYAVLAGSALIGAALLVAVLDLATRLAIPAGLRVSFLLAAPFVILMALLRSLVGTLLPTPAHLRRRLPLIVGLSAMDCACTCIGALAAAALWPGSAAAVLAGAAAGAAVSMALGLLLLRRESFAMPWRPMALSVVALALSWLISLSVVESVVVSTALALIAVIAFGASPFLTFTRWIAR